MASGTSTTPEGTRGPYTAMAHFWDILLTNVAENVSTRATWTLVGPVPPGTSMTGNMLAAGAVATNTAIQLRAEYGYEGRTEADSMTVTIVAQGIQEVTRLLALTFTWTFERQTGTYFGTIRMTNPAASLVALTRDFLLAVHPHAEYRFMVPTGVMADGDSYVDITQQVLATLQQVGNQDVVFDSGETIEIRNIELYSRRRILPAGSSARDRHRVARFRPQCSEHPAAEKARGGLSIDRPFRGMGESLPVLNRWNGRYSPG